MGKTKQERVVVLLKENRAETLQLAFAYIAMWGPPRDRMDWSLVDERLRRLSKALVASH